MQPPILTAAVVATLLGSVAAGPVQSSQVQTSTGGTIIGHAASNKTSVTEFLGIRYAEAPVGELRFAAPKKYVAPQGTVFEASEWVCLLLFHTMPLCLVLTILVSVCTPERALLI
jgi:hypothetical protein